MPADPVRAEPMLSGLVEIACDESGFSGTNLLDQDVFAHASVRLGVDAARRCVELVRARSPYPAGEYKSAQLLRPAQRPVLNRLLGPGGPLYGRGAVQVIDKSFLLAGRISAVFSGELSYASGTSLDSDEDAEAMALVLHHQGPAEFGRVRWEPLLQAFIELLKAKNDGQFAKRTDSFLAVAADLRADGVGGELGAALRVISAGRSRLEALQERYFYDRTLLPPLEVLIPALLETARYWGAGERRVAVVHDEQSALTRHRIAQLNLLLATPGAGGGAGARPGAGAGVGAGAGAEGGGDAGAEVLVVRQVDSRDDPRVQVADLLAGAARQITTAELRGRGDPSLTALLRPYLGPHPIWSHPTSWSRLAG